MATSVFRVQCELPMTSGLPEDSSVNTFHFIADDASPTLIDDMQDALGDFYNGTSGNGTVLSEMSSEIDKASANITVYDLADPEPRAPIAQVGIALPGALGANGGPHEVSLCLSFEGPHISGLSQASRRGRIYLGPLKQQSSRPATAGICRKLADAGDRLLAATGITWAVYSPTRRANGNTLLQSAVAVTNGWVDDEWDTQRRRGLTPLARVGFS